MSDALEQSRDADEGAEGATAWEDMPIDTSVPSVARVYDAALGGTDNFAVDRALLDEIFALVPESQEIPHGNRAWLKRATRWLVAEAGIRQIIDIGSGLPTTSNIHDFAQSVAPETKVVYIDHDPLVLAHGKAILASNDNTAFLTADARDPASIFENAELRSHIDLERPFAVFLASVLHHLPRGEDQRVAAEVRRYLSAGSYLAMTNFHDSGDPRARTIEKTFTESPMGSGWFRPYPQHRMYFGDLELVTPGLCPLNEWRPDEDTPSDSPVHHLYLGGVGHRPAR